MLGDKSKTYVSQVAYAPHGGISQMLFNNGLWTSAGFNNQLQQTSATLGTGQAPNNVWGLTNTFVSPNNGNLASQSLTVPGLSSPIATAYTWDGVNRLAKAMENASSPGAAQCSQTGSRWCRFYLYNQDTRRLTERFLLNGNPTQITETARPSGSSLAFTQTYGYDGVNRLSSIAETNPTGSWSQNFSYDAFGNLAASTPSASPSSAAPPSTSIPTQLSSYSSLNRIAGGSYDANGNQTVLGSSNLKYDIENRQYEADDNTGSGRVVTYGYDGSGQRVSMNNNGTVTTYVHDAFGNLAAEYTAASTTLPPCLTCYLSWDHLGSTRMVTNETGSYALLHDYLPFGTQIFGGTAGRTSAWETTDSIADSVTARFTSQDHDYLTNLEFYQARYMGNAIGRFTTPDPANAGADPTNPQTWNMYSYVGNNPLAYVDPSGLYTADAGNPDCIFDYSCFPNPDPGCDPDDLSCPSPGFPGSDPGAVPLGPPPAPPPLPASPGQNQNSGAYSCQASIQATPFARQTCKSAPNSSRGPSYTAPPLTLGAAADPRIVSLFRNIQEHLEKIAASEDQGVIKHWTVEMRAWRNEILRRAGKITQKRPPGALDEYLKRTIGVTSDELNNLFTTPIILVPPCFVNPALPSCRKVEVN